MDQDTGKLLNNQHSSCNPIYRNRWDIASANKLGHLAQGVSGRVKGTNIIKIIKKSQILKERVKDVTYNQFVCTIQNQKAEKNRMIFFMGGN